MTSFNHLLQTNFEFSVCCPVIEAVSNFGSSLILIK